MNMETTTEMKKDSSSEKNKLSTASEGSSTYSAGSDRRKTIENAPAPGEECAP
jgi:hypothetical protein